jgi:hypothetical protein
MLAEEASARRLALEHCSMSSRDPKRPPPVSPPAGDAEKSSGRVRFDERGQAVWEWQLKTGHFSSNATSSKLRALTNTELSIEDPAAKPLAVDKEAGSNPYDTIKPSGKGLPLDPPAGGHGMNPYGTLDEAGKAKEESKGADPYARGPTKNPNTVSYNPYERPKPKKPVR